MELRQHSAENMVGLSELRAIHTSAAVVIRPNGSFDVYGDVAIVDQRETEIEAQERREKLEYERLSDYEKGAYDHVGQRGANHRACLEAAHSI